MMTFSTNIPITELPPFPPLPKLFDALDLTNSPPDQLALISQIDNLLPQTQCGLCGHPDGCLPYAVAIITQNEAHNQCVPGGQPVTDQIAQLLGRPHLIAEPSQWQTDPTTHRPTEMRAIIREDDCIGCTKCIPACPVDAIIGSGKRMHTIFTDLCTGCELCIEPCPVDCIELVAFPRALTESEREAEQADLRQRYYAHLERVETQVNDVTNAKPVVSMVQAKLINSEEMAIDISEMQAKNTIEMAKIRSQIKKLEKQLAVRADENKQAELNSLKEKLHNFEA